MEVDVLEDIPFYSSMGEQGKSSEVGFSVNQIGESVSKSGYIRFPIKLESMKDMYQLM